MSGVECILCRQTTDDELQLGKKYTCNGITAHYFCLLLTSNLIQRGNDNEGIMGFLTNDIKSEVNRASKLFCAFCKEKTATIGCCIRSCRKSFHLPCALKNQCRLEFVDPFKSFCDIHNAVKKPKNCHKSTDLCTICYDDMGEYDPIQSIQSPCCNPNTWYHKLCLMKYAQTSGYFLKCPLCNDVNQFRESISKKGVFIPDSDAKWEETGPNSFYDFTQHSERPNKCSAKTCKCPRGRKYDAPDEHDKHSFIYCHYCGSQCIHRGCNMGELFLCEECSTIRHDTTIDAEQPTQSSTNRRRRSHSGNQSTSRQSSRMNRLANIDLNDSKKDYYVIYSETKVESETTTVTRMNKVHVLRNCYIPISRLEIPKSKTTEEASVTDTPVKSILDEDSEQIKSVQNSTSATEIESYGSEEDDVIIGEKKKKIHFFSSSDSDDVIIGGSKKKINFLSSSDSDEETKSADERDDSNNEIIHSYHSSGFDLNDNSTKTIISSINERKTESVERKSESSGIGSSMSFFWPSTSSSSSESSISDEIRKSHRQKKRQSLSKIFHISESTDCNSSASETKSHSSVDTDVKVFIPKSAPKRNFSSNSNMTAIGYVQNIVSSPYNRTNINEQITKNITKCTNNSSSSDSEPTSIVATKHATTEKNTKISELNESSSSDFGSNSSPINKRKRRTIKDFFSETSSEEDAKESSLSKQTIPKRTPRKIPKRSETQRSIAEMLEKYYYS